MTHDETMTRRFIASILGVLGIVVLLDVLAIAVMQPEAKVDGFRQVLFVIVGGLLVISGAVTFSWPKRGTVETLDNREPLDQSGKGAIEQDQEAPHPND
jgi:uncharacterized membrane protein YedE/YeeE